MPKYRILCLDGGGPWALIQVKALQKLYAPDAQGHDILKDFDLVAANSGGSLTLAGLIENRKLNDLLSNYFMNEQNRKAVFREVDFWPRVRDFIFYWLGIGPKYSTHAKRVALTGILSSFGTELLSKIQEKIEGQKGKCPHFLICAFDYDRKRAMCSPIISGSVVRMNPMIQPKLINGSWLPPPELDCDEFKAIAELPVDALEQPDVERVSRLCDLWLDNNSNIPNQPIRSNSKDFTCEIGHPSFSEARAAWIALKKIS